MDNNKVFISHSSEDRQTATTLCAYLEAKNIQCWIAPRNINVGKDYAQSIMEAIESSAIMILVLSKAANDSKHVRNEIERAFNHQLVIMPFRVQNIMPGKALEYFLSSTHWLDAFDEKPEKYFSLLYDNCKAILNNDDKPLLINTENKKTSKLQKPTQTKKYLLITFICLIVLAGIIFLFQTMDHKKSLTANKNILNTDSIIAKKNDSNLTANNKDQNKTKERTEPVTTTKKSSPEKKDEKNINESNDKEGNTDTQLPASVNGVYFNPATNDELILNSSGYFSGTVQNKSVSGKLKHSSGKSYKISGYNISGSFNFNNAYNSFSGTIVFTNLPGADASFNMIKK